MFKTGECTDEAFSWHRVLASECAAGPDRPVRHRIEGTRVNSEAYRGCNGTLTSACPGTLSRAPGSERPNVDKADAANGGFVVGVLAEESSGRLWCVKSALVAATDDAKAAAGLDLKPAQSGDLHFPGGGV